MMRDRLTLLGLGIAAAFFGTTAVAQNVRAISLPVEVSYPEGIGFDPAGYIFVAGASDGTLVRLDLKSGRSTLIAKAGVLLPADSEIFPRMLGMKVDSAKRLWIAGGRTGKIFVLDTNTGRLVKQLTVPGTGSVLNDAVVTTDAVYVTDTLRPTLWRIPLQGNQIGEPEAWVDFNGTPIEYAQGRNLNGIAKNSAGTSLIVIQMDKGLLFKIDAVSKAVVPIDVGEEVLTAGDGLELDGNTLYLVRQSEAEVVALRLSPDFRSGKVIARFKDPALQWPATAVKVGNELLVVNSQFNKRTTKDPLTPFTVVAIPLSKFSGT
jgi:Cu-Zn family superoxide dismutase